MDQLIFQKHNYRFYESPYQDIYLYDEHPAAVVILALCRNKIAICKQYREGVGRNTYELPGGSIEPDENTEAAARRELLEETGLTCDKLFYLGQTEPDPCLSNQFSYLFFTNHAVLENKQDLDDGEKIDVSFHNPEEVFQNVTEGRWNNSELVHTLFLARQKGFL
ncbi:MAG TPA: NUDIX hydrolase [Bacillales bacterium]|nr:NUDIX hydrolase [Bacillales bacterium]